MNNKIPHILIVDDELDQLAIMSDVLRAKGFEPLSAQTGAAALAQLEEHDFDVALIDLRLGDVSGLDVLSGIKARAPQTECILLTGHATKDSAIKAMQMNAFGFFQKPFDMEQVLLSIQRAVEKRAAGDALRESERFAQATVDALSSHLAILDETGVILAVNRAWREFAESNSAGMKLNVYEGANYLSVCETSQGENSEETPAMTEGIRAVISGAQKEFSLEYPCHAPHEKRWFNARVTRFPGAGAVRVVVAHENITERKLAEEALAASDAELRALFSSMQDVVIVIDRDGVYRKIAPTHTDLLFMPPNLLLGKTLRDVFAPEQAEKLLGIVRQVLSTSRTMQVEYQLLIGARTLWFETSISPMNADYSLWVARDITGRKQSEELVRSSEENLNKAQHYAHVGSWTWNIKTSQLHWSDEMYRIFGIDRASFTGNLSDVIARAIHPDDREKVNQSNLSVSEQGKPIALEYRIVWQDGTIRVVWAEAGELILDEEGNPALLSGIVQDITARKQAEEELRLHSTIIDNMAEGVYLIRLRDGIIVYTNPTFEYLFGYGHHEMIGKHVSTVNAPADEDPEIIAGKIVEVIEKTGMWTGEIRNIKKDGTLFWSFANVSLFNHPEHGKVMVAVHSDITARKQAEDTLARTNQRLQSLRLIDHALLGASVEGGSADLEALRHLAALVPCGKISIIALDEISDSARIIARVADEKLSVSRMHEPVLIGQLRLKEIHGDEVLVVKIGTGKINPFEKRLYNAGARSLAKSPLIVQGKLIGVLVLSSVDPDFFTPEYLEIIKDVSAQLAISLHHENLLHEIRRHAEQLEKRVQERTAEIEATRQRLELAVNAGEIGVWEVNLRENKVVWDKHMHLMHGTRPADFDHSFDTWQQMIHPQDAASSQKNLRVALERTGVLVDEHRIVRADGLQRHITANAVVLYGADHQPERMIGVNVDVTERREAEETMRRANAEMERALRIKDEFLANMSHELRTPLNAVMGISESLLEQTIGALNEKQQRYIATINESGVHLLSLINDILDLSKIEAGRMELSVADVPIHLLFESSFRMVKELAQRKNIPVSFEADERAQTVRGDSRRLLQMLVNLLSNAVKFTPEGGKAGVRVLADPDLDEINITVWDTGIGIAEEDLPRLFQSFVQLDSSLSREYSGTGLGLMLVMQMARMHGGNINVESKLNQGSRFTISLPWLPARPDFAGAGKIGKTESARPPEKTRAGNILLMEDTESVIMLVNDYLQARGHRVLIARNGLSGINLAKAEHPDLILLDIQMPGMNGFEVIKSLRADASLKDMPVIALTALAMSGDRERCLAAGMTDYLSKPIHLNELAQMVGRYLVEQSPHD